MRFHKLQASWLLLCCVLLALPAWAQENTTTPPAQIILQPHVVSIILNDEHRDGVDWEAIVSDFHAVTLKGDDAVENKRKLSVGAVSDEDYGVLLDALDAVGKVTQVDQETVTLTADAKQTLAFLKEDVKNSVSLDVELTIDSKGEKQLMLQPTIKGKVGSTSLDLKPSSTIVMGSIFYEHEVTKTHKFPLLGDLPIVGLVFRNKGKLMQRVETIIFLTAKGQ